MRAIHRFFMPPPLNSPDLTIRGIGITEWMSPCVIDRVRGTGDYLFMMFSKPVTVYVGGVAEDCDRDTMVIWTPGTYQCYGNRREDYCHSWIHCDGTRIACLVRATGIPTNVPFKLTDGSVVDRYLWDIYREVTTHAAPSNDIVMNSMHSWMTEMARQIDGETATVPASFLSLAHYMGENLDQRLTLAMLADRVNLSASHFSVRFKQCFGLSPIDYLIELRLHTASNLLRDGTRSVAEIAKQVGYEDAFHFSKQFKARFGANPRDARRVG